MLRKMSNPSALCVLCGLVLGLGLALILQGQPSFATATDHADDFSIATGHMTVELEGVYVLDFKAGKLLGTVMNRQSGKFQQFYERNLAEDFALNLRQKPKFIMVTGAMQSARAQVPLNHVLYVAELNSGRMGAFYMPFRGELAKGTVSEQLQVLDIIPFRQSGAAK